MLEVGAGVGTYTTRLLAAGAASVLALESDPAALPSLRGRVGRDARVEIRTEELPGAPSVEAAAGTFDLVVCQNVLEHIEDDAGALAAMRGALVPGGRLALVVPNDPRLYGSLDRVYGHRRRYRRGELADLVERTGLEVELAQPFNLLGVLGWVVSSRLDRSAIDPRPLRLFDLAVPLWRRLEDRVRPPYGLSLVVLARRPDDG